MRKKTPEPTMIPSETDLAWAAGIIDGEGCIHVKIASWTRVPRHELQLCIPNTSEPMIRKIQAMFGGGFYLRRKPNPNRRRVAQWEVCGVRAAIVLRKVLPYLVAKKAEAELGIEMADTLMQKKDYNANSGMGAPRPPAEVLERRQAIREELQRLKRIEYTFENSTTTLVTVGDT